MNVAYRADLIHTFTQNVFRETFSLLANNGKLKGLFHFIQNINTLCFKLLSFANVNDYHLFRKSDLLTVTLRGFFFKIDMLKGQQTAA